MFPLLRTYVGITVNASLTYDEHVTNLVSSCAASLCQINRIEYVLDRQTLMSIIKALVSVNYIVVVPYGPTH